MNSTSDFVLYNLYIDESGFYYIGESRYRFFILSAVIISPDQKSLVDLLFSNFRNKYLMKPGKCFHAADFFEDHAPNYKKRELKMPRTMHKAVEDLMDIMSHVKFDALSSYCDIPRIRKRLMIKEPPVKRPLMTQTEIVQYKIDKNRYRQNIEQTIGNKRNCPLTMTINKSLQFHSAKLVIHEENEIYHRPVKGYINFESQKESDSIIIDNFHKYQDMHYTYGDNLIGINLHTKGSLDGGIQLADLISYITCQSLRSKYNLDKEMLLNVAMLKYVRDIRKEMSEKYQVKMFNVSEMDI